VKRLLAVIPALFLVLAAAGPALGHTAEVTGDADCDTWHVEVTVFDTTSDRRIVIETTIDGTDGLDETGHPADGGGEEVWSAGGASPVSGTVTVSIFKPDGNDWELEDGPHSLTIMSPEDCEPEETPVETPEETPVETPEETPVETPVVTPVETPVVTPVVTPEENVQGGTGTPAASLPNSAANADQGMPWAAMTFVLLLLASLTGLATVNAKTHGDDDR
jgi:hypothetical protein